MMDSHIKILISQCRLLASQRGDALANSNPKKANKLYKELICLLPKLRDFGKAGEDALLSLSDDPNDEVACWAATHSLKHNPEKAIDSLRRIADKQSLTGFTASMVIKQWDKGELKLPGFNE